MPRGAAATDAAQGEAAPPGGDVVLYSEKRTVPAAAEGGEAAEWEVAVVDVGATVGEQDCSEGVRIHGRRVDADNERVLNISVNTLKVRVLPACPSLSWGERPILWL